MECGGDVVLIRMILRGAVGAVLAGALGILGTMDRAAHYQPPDGRSSHVDATPVESLTHQIEQSVQWQEIRERRVGR